MLDSDPGLLRIIANYLKLFANLKRLCRIADTNYSRGLFLISGFDLIGFTSASARRRLPSIAGEFRISSS